MPDPSIRPAQRATQRSAQIQASDPPNELPTHPPLRCAALLFLLQQLGMARARDHVGTQVKVASCLGCAWQMEGAVAGLHLAAQGCTPHITEVAPGSGGSYGSGEVMEVVEVMEVMEVVEPQTWGLKTNELAADEVLSVGLKSNTNNTR